MPEYLAAFTILWFWRYTRLIVNCISSWTFKPTPLPQSPFYTSRDVSVIIPTIASGDGLAGFYRCLISCLKCGPAAILVTTPARCLNDVEQVINEAIPTNPFWNSKVTLWLSPAANKRQQLCVAIPNVKTDLTILADDDVIWPPNFLPQITAPFEHPNVGGVGTKQRILRSTNPGVWGYLNACYIERRNFEISATNQIDGGVSCLSGRTVAYRSEILQSPTFLDKFTDEKFFGTVLHADDDNFITRWLVARKWDIRIQSSPNSEVLTTLDRGWKYLAQCLRWARSNWRSNMTSMFYERHIWTRQPWCSYALYLAMFQHSLIMDPLLATLLYKGLEHSVHRSNALWAFACWLLVTKTVKLIPHYWRYPSDLRYIPVTILFGYFHGFIKLYALFTLRSQTSWGSKQTDGDERGKKRPSVFLPDGVEDSEEARCLLRAAGANTAAGHYGIPV